MEAADQEWLPSHLFEPWEYALDLLIFPHQLFHGHPGLELNPDRIVLIEDSLFWGDWNYPMKFHQQKLWLHRAAMKRYQSRLNGMGFDTIYRDYDSQRHSLKKHLSQVVESADPSPKKFAVCHPTDFILQKRLEAFCENSNIKLEYLNNPGFLNSPQENIEYRESKSRWFMADFYKWQRKRFDLLMEGDEPAGGKWSFDEENRRKVPQKQLGEIPDIPELERDTIDHEAADYVCENFPEHPGNLQQLYYPTSHVDAAAWLQDFLEHRFSKFGDFEDAIEEGESWLWHSILTPCLNIGLLTPRQVIDASTQYAQSHDIPINSLEGFVRQVIGWREFIRATYEDVGVQMRNGNHWNHQRSIPDCFYDGTTGLIPIDDTIKRILRTGYCHHIERLMVLGGFMFLCEIRPNEIYRWFMEMFVDSYDWVMVPNVYSMSQHAAGGLITTKPYFSSSNYVRKMSHYKSGPWCDIWDGLYWRWIWNHIDELSENHRWAMMCSQAKKMEAEKRKKHLKVADEFLEKRFD